VRDVDAATVQTELTRTEVVFEKLAADAIDWYISTGEWMGRAGAYAIQGKGAALIKEVRGCFTNVIGISIPVLLRMLAEIS
jgi:septum formation protein